MPSNRISRSTSSSVICATRSASKSQKALRYPSRFLRIVIQLNPAWALSSTRNSNSVLSSVTNFPHSRSWYFTYSSSVPHQPQRPFMMSCIITMFEYGEDSGFAASCQISTDDSVNLQTTNFPPDRPASEGDRPPAKLGSGTLAALPALRYRVSQNRFRFYLPFRILR